MKIKKPIDLWENPYKRKTAVILACLIFIPILPLKILYSLFIQGFPDTWYDIKELVSRDTVETLKKGWVGRESYYNDSDKKE